MNPVAILLGRLSPRGPGEPLQRFPPGAWAGEIEAAAGLGFDAVEWLVSTEPEADNPLWSDDGARAIARTARAAGVTVPVVLADVFAARPLRESTGGRAGGGPALLTRLVRQAAALGARTVVLPALGASAAPTRADLQRLLDAAGVALDAAASLHLTVAIETDAAPESLAAVLDATGHPALGACHDTGNAAAAGRDAAGAIAVLGRRLAHVHVKDRPRGGPNVPLGGGAVDFTAVFDALAAAGYGGPVTLETAVGADPLASARAHLAFVREGLSRARMPVP